MKTRTQLGARQLAILCGVISSPLYLATDVLGALRYEGYSYAHQAVSELSAIDAPTRPFMVALFIVYSLLAGVFATAVARDAEAKSSLRITGWILFCYAALNLVAPFFPMHLRGAGVSLTDHVHVALTAMTVIMILLALGFGAASFGPAFRAYSIGTIVALLASGGRAFVDGARIDAGLPTPWFGLIERAGIYAFMLWVFVLALILAQPLRTPRLYFRTAG